MDRKTIWYISGTTKPKKVKYEDVTNSKHDTSNEECKLVEDYEFYYIGRNEGLVTEQCLTSAGMISIAWGNSKWNVVFPDGTETAFDFLKHACEFVKDTCTKNEWTPLQHPKSLADSEDPSRLHCLTDYEHFHSFKTRLSECLTSGGMVYVHNLYGSKFYIVFPDKSEYAVSGLLKQAYDCIKRICIKNKWAPLAHPKLVADRSKPMPKHEFNLGFGLGNYSGDGDYGKAYYDEVMSNYAKIGSGSTVRWVHRYSDEYFDWVRR